MKIKKVTRYYCEFCKKSKGTKYSMEIHEEHCTMNPNRICRMCNFIGEKQRNKKEIENFVSEIKKETQNKTEEETSGLCTKFLERTKRFVHGCPVCMLSVFRFSCVPMFLWNWEFKTELNKKLEEINARIEQDNYCYPY